MARPRVFVSSTFYDLRHIRADLEKFIGAMGYESVLHERGHVPYGSADKLESYCYREIDQVDILVHIIGGRFGSESFDASHSISQMELKVAVRLNKQVYVFIDKAVYSDFRHYSRNKGITGIRYDACEDERILSFIEEVEALQRNNQRILFETADEIVGHLREQWAGLFQRFLQEQERLPHRQIAEDMENALKTLNQLITYLTKESKDQNKAVRQILLLNHPVFPRLKTLTGTSYRVFFVDRKEMEAWLGARSWKPVQEFEWDDAGIAEYSKAADAPGDILVLKVSTSIFEPSGRLREFTSDEWKDDWVWIDKVESEPELPEFSGKLDNDDDDLPF